MDVRSWGLVELRVLWAWGAGALRLTTFIAVINSFEKKTIRWTKRIISKVQLLRQHLRFGAKGGDQGRVQAIVSGGTACQRECRAMSACVELRNC